MLTLPGLLAFGCVGDRFIEGEVGSEQDLEPADSTSAVPLLPGGDAGAGPGLGPVNSTPIPSSPPPPGGPNVPVPGAVTPTTTACSEASAPEPTAVPSASTPPVAEPEPAAPAPSATPTADTEHDPVCGNGVLEPGEQCDGESDCTSDCRLVIDGEDDDEPTPAPCTSDCFPPVCGDGVLAGSEECDPPATGSCSAGCTKIACGNDRVDEGEDCDPPSVGTCNEGCLAVECGDGRLDVGEQCEPFGANDPACSASCTSLDDAFAMVTLYAFDGNLQGWQLYATSPERLFSGTRVAHDAQNGDQTPGVLEIGAPFDAPNQKVEVQVTFDPVNLTGRTLHARVRLGSGLGGDANHPGGIKLFAKSGDDYAYASGAWTLLPPGGGWLDVTLDCDDPILVPEEFDPSTVRQVGVELRTFDDTTQVSPAVVYVDSLGY